MFQHLNHRVPEGEEEEQEIENLFEKIMKENFPNFVKEIDIQVQEAQRVPNQLDPKRTIKKNQSEMNDTLTEMKKNLQRINSRVDEAKNQISDLEYKEAKNNQSGQ